MEKPWKVVFAFLAVFVAGAVFGGFFSIAVGSRWLAAQTKHEAAAEPASPLATGSPAVPTKVAPLRPNEPRPLQHLPFPWDAKQLMRRYAERLQLTPEQRERLQPVIKRAVQDYRRIQQTTFRDTSILVQHLQEDIARELTPEQRAKLDEMREHQREFMKRFDEWREQLRAMQKQNAAPSQPAAGATPSTEPTPASEPAAPSSR